MKEMTQTIKRLVVGIVLALSLTSILYGQIPPLPDPGTNAPPTEAQLAAAYAAWLAGLSNNLASVSEWLHDGYAMPDGTPADFQTIMDQQATDFSSNAGDMAAAQQSALDAAWTWAINNGVPLVVIGAGAQSVADILWMAKKGAPFHSLKDLVGHKVGYTAPGSVTNMLILMAMKAQGIDPATIRPIEGRRRARISPASLAWRCPASDRQS